MFFNLYVANLTQENKVDNFDLGNNSILFKILILIGENDLVNLFDFSVHT